MGDGVGGKKVVDKVGYSVALDYNLLAVGTPRNNASGRLAGYVQMYDWSDNAWTQQGEDIESEATDYTSGWLVGLDGSLLAIGELRNDGNSFNSGHLWIYRWGDKTWKQRQAIPLNFDEKKGAR